MGNYYLMHKNNICASMILDEDDADAKPQRVRIYEPCRKHFPIGGQMNNVRFVEWWKDRAIPKTRQGAKTALQKLGYESTANALISNLALSLTDCYWIKPENSQYTWEEVNLFANGFQDVFGELTFSNSEDIRKDTDFLKSVSTQGEVQKKWEIDSSGRRFLVKGNYGASYQQSINEVFASKLHETQQWTNYTPYRLTKIRLEDGAEGLGCMSYNFCSEHVESVSAWELLQTRKKRSDESYFSLFKNICLDMGIAENEFTRFMDYEIMTDFLLSNIDRHMNNISILRDPDTLEVIGFAPIYDTGNSMFYNIPYEEIKNIQPGEQRVVSFIDSKEVNLLRYVTDRSVVDLSKCSLDFSIYKKDTEERQKRISKIEDLYYQKANMLEAFQKGKDIWTLGNTKNTFFFPQETVNERLSALEKEKKLTTERSTDGKLR